MCLAIPGRLLEITREQGMLFGKVEFAGKPKRVCLDLVPEVQIGNYVLVYAGFATATVAEEEAQSILQILDEIISMDELQAPPESRDPGG